MNIVFSISFPCRNAVLTPILSRVQPFEAMIAKAMQTLSHKQVDDSVRKSCNS